MNIALWIAAGLLAAVMLGAGLMKSLQPREKLIASGLGFVDDVPLGLVRFIGIAEVLAAVGLILPPLVDIGTIFVPLAATGLVLMMIGAIVVHARRKEYKSLPVNVGLLLLAAFVAWGRFGPYAF
jgi:hypothetical protein